MTRENPDLEGWIKLTNEQCCELEFDNVVLVDHKFHRAVYQGGFHCTITLHDLCGIKSAKITMTFSKRLPDGTDDIWVWGRDLTIDLKCDTSPSISLAWGSPGAYDKPTLYDGVHTYGKYVGNWPKDWGSSSDWTINAKVEGQTCCDKEYSLTCPIHSAPRTD